LSSSVLGSDESVVLDFGLLFLTSGDLPQASRNIPAFVALSNPSLIGGTAFCAEVCVGSSVASSALSPVVAAGPSILFSQDMGGENINPVASYICLNADSSLSISLYPMIRSGDNDEGNPIFSCTFKSRV
jgi:hypothetical protein